MSKPNAPFRYDIVGSFLRPQTLREATVKYEAGKISKEELTKAEDEAIGDLILKQKEAGLSVITDGEFRRSWWHLDFFWGLTGIRKKNLQKGYIFHEEVTRGETALVEGKISGENHPFVEHFKYVKAYEDDSVTARQTIPAPAQLLAEITRSENAKITKEFYPDEEELILDIAKAYQTVIADLYAAGCKNVQFDDCTWGMYCDKNFWEMVGIKEEDVAHIAKQYVYLNNLAIEGKAKDMVITTHVCRGNYHSTWASQGGYEPVAQYLFGKENVDAFYLEFDDERSGDFKPLRFVSENKKVVLGLVTSKSPVLEEKEVIKRRIRQAAEYVPLERLSLSPQCGFASTEEGNKLTEDEQWEKIRLIREIAGEVWNLKE